jgi:putative Mn2+ efflux pump MntP
MNNFEIVTLALSLVFSSWNSYLKAGLGLEGTFVRRFSYSGIMFMMQFGLAGAGIWVGYKFGSPEMRVNIMISFSIILIVGLFVLLSNIRPQSNEKEFDYSDKKAIFLSALTEGIIPLIIGGAIGILSTTPYLHWLLTGLILISGIMAAQIFAVFKGLNSLKIRLGAAGGLLFLAAAIKLALNIARF